MPLQEDGLTLEFKFTLLMAMDCCCWLSRLVILDVLGKHDEDEGNDKGKTVLEEQDKERSELLLGESEVDIVGDSDWEIEQEDVGERVSRGGWSLDTACWFWEVFAV